MDLKAARELAGISQFTVARKAGIPRMRLSLAECGEIELQPEEKAAVRQVLRRAIEQRTAALQDALSSITRAGEHARAHDFGLGSAK
jgi:transcriptional regulator with XRE-family HTH domain